MGSGPRIAVIGAGALGLSAAWHLVKAGHREVTVLEATHVAAGSSSRSVGMVETQYVDPYEIEMRAYGRQVFDDLESQHGLPFAREGYLRLAHDTADMQAYEASAMHQAAIGCDGRVIGPEEIARRIPDLAPSSYVGGLWGPSDGHVDGYTYCNLLASLVRASGAQIVTLGRLLGATRSNGGSTNLSVGQSVISADIVVNAAGAWAGHVGALLGAPVPLAPQLHEVLTIRLARPLGYVMPFVMDYVPRSGTEGVYLRQDGPLALLAGFHSDEAIDAAEDPDVPLTPPHPEFAERLAVRLAALLPDLQDAGPGSGWSGLYPTSIDGSPIVGPHPEAPHVICAAGAGGVGIQLSPAIGRAVAEFCLTGASASVPPSSTWSASRVSAGRSRRVRESIERPQ
jgi:sarcosine oxidase, subunit beta